MLRINDEPRRPPSGSVPRCARQSTRAGCKQIRCVFPGTYISEAILVKRSLDLTIREFAGINLPRGADLTKKIGSAGQQMVKLAGELVAARVENLGLAHVHRTAKLGSIRLVRHLPGRTSIRFQRGRCQSRDGSCRSNSFSVMPPSCAGDCCWQRPGCERCQRFRGSSCSGAVSDFGFCENIRRAALRPRHRPFLSSAKAAGRTGRSGHPAAIPRRSLLPVLWAAGNA
jgi:hypothetical protein